MSSVGSRKWMKPKETEWEQSLTVRGLPELWERVFWGGGVGCTCVACGKFPSQGLNQPQLQPTPQLQQRQILNPRCGTRDQTLAATETTLAVNPLHYSRNSQECSEGRRNSP